MSPFFPRKVGCAAFCTLSCGVQDAAGTPDLHPSAKEGGTQFVRVSATPYNTPVTSATAYNTPTSEALGALQSPPPLQSSSQSFPGVSHNSSFDMGLGVTPPTTPATVPLKQIGDKIKVSEELLLMLRERLLSSATPMTPNVCVCVCVCVCRPLA